MKQVYALLVACMCFVAAGRAQDPGEMLNKWSQRNPIEKIYVQFDRDAYIAGETAWFKVYLLSDYQPDTISSSVYVELLKDSVQVISRQVLPVLLGASNGQFELPDSLVTGQYHVRAYTVTMLNQVNGNCDFFYHRSLTINGKKAPAATAALATKPSIYFFPEGGNMVKGLPATVAFRATGANGFPVNASGTVRNSKGEEIAKFSSYHDGLGMFEIPSVADNNYYATVDGWSQEQIPLPAPVEKGIHISLINHPHGYLFELQQKTGDPVFQASYMIGQMQHHLVFRQQFASGKENLQGVLDTRNLNSGILQVTFFNAAHQPLAERLVFVNNSEFKVEGTIKEDSIDFRGKARNRITLALKDTIRGSFAVSIYDDAFASETTRSENIITSLLLTSDLPGLIHRPSWYFEAPVDSALAGMDLVMMTNGWRRFRWEELPAKLQSNAGYNDGAFITLSGKVNYQGLKKPFADKDVLLFVNARDGKRSTQFIHTDKDGYFKLDSMVFFEKSRLLFSDVRGKKSQFIDVLLGPDSLRRRFSLPPVRFSTMSGQEKQDNRWQMDYDAILKANGQMLEEVKLKSIKKSPLQIVDDRYTTGAFSGDASKSIDLVNSDEAEAYQNVFDYLRARVNGLQVTADGFDYTVYYRQNSSMSSMGDIPMTLFLDEIETDASVISTIPASQVALVKVYTSFAGAAGNAPGGMLSIYTKKGEDYANGSGVANQVPYSGYAVIKEFYSPDYKKEEGRTDNRITLVWKPNMVLNSINPEIRIPFYNSDRTKRYRVVVEGVTVGGKLLSIEKQIGNPGRAF